MLSDRSIRFKLRVGVGLLGLSTVLLFGAAHYGLYAYRGLVKTLSARATELPLANELSQRVADLRVVLGKAREGTLNKLSNQEPSDQGYLILPLDGAEEAVEDAIQHESEEADWELGLLRDEFRTGYDGLRSTLEAYRERLVANLESEDSRIRGAEPELKTLKSIDRVLRRIDREDMDDSIELEQLGAETDSLETQIERLRVLTARLPSHLHRRLGELSSQVKSQYHYAIGLAWATFVSALGLLALSYQVFRTAIARPVQSLVAGARNVAAGDFGHRVRLDSNDEMGELAEAMNRMMASFQQTRDELDQQVRDRTNQVIRSEQLASVGFLAAGVAHEINNPLAAIAMCSESLESRVAELGAGDAGREDEWRVVRSYLETIGKESFRCKQITEKLLDFSRLGDRERRATDLRELVAGVVSVVRHVGKYKHKEVELVAGEPVLAEVDAQEMKQVLLNLVTNGLDSLDAGGRVTIDIRRTATPEGDQARVVVRDNGCGMTDEVKKHLFEPFFTRRRGGQGTGLGLSITYRIVEEHHGELIAESDGPGTGSAFTLTLPTEQPFAAKAA